MAKFKTNIYRERAANYQRYIEEQEKSQAAFGGGSGANSDRRLSLQERAQTERERVNRVRERSQGRSLSERERSNLSREEIQGRGLSERERSNRSRESFRGRQQSFRENIQERQQELRERQADQREAQQEATLKLREQQLRLNELNLQLAQTRMTAAASKEEAAMKRAIEQQEQLPFAREALSQIDPADPTAGRQILQVRGMYPLAFNGKSEDIRDILDQTTWLQETHKKTVEDNRALAKEYNVSYEDLIETDEAGNQKFNPSKAQEIAAQRAKETIAATGLQTKGATVDPNTGKVSINYEAAKPEELPTAKNYRDDTKAAAGVDIPPDVLYGSPYRPVGGIETGEDGKPIGFLPPPDETATGEQTIGNRLVTGTKRALTFGLAGQGEEVGIHDQVGFEFRGEDGSMQYRAIPRRQYDELIAENAEAYHQRRQTPAGPVTPTAPETPAVPMPAAPTFRFNPETGELDKVE